MMMPSWPAKMLFWQHNLLPNVVAAYCCILFRYKHLHGQHVVHPVSGRRIPIIADAELVDMEFGTGGGL
jgi:hypothetical protein